MIPPIAIVTFLISAAIHVPLVWLGANELARFAERRTGHSIQPLGLLITGLVFAIVMAVWCGWAATILSRQANRWGGLHAFQVVVYVAGLCLVVDALALLAGSYCGPPALAVPILSLFWLNNISAPDQSAEPDGSDTG